MIAGAVSPDPADRAVRTSITPLPPGLWPIAAIREPSSDQAGNWKATPGTAKLRSQTVVAQIVDVADARENMPAKSTFFHPKLPSGLVVHPLHG